jgi:hypothetical protein
MSVMSWQEVINFYDKTKWNDNGKELEWIQKFVEELVVSRDLDSVYPFTSHEVLCITKFKTYPEWFDKPLLTIEINWSAVESFKYKFSLIQREEGEVLREFVESVYCSFEKSLETFDEMVAKLEKVSQ